MGLLMACGPREFDGEPCLGDGTSNDNCGLGCQVCVGAEQCTPSTGYIRAFCYGGDRSVTWDAGRTPATDTVRVTMQYDYVKSSAGACPNYTFTQQTCSYAVTIKKTSLDAVVANYPTCSVSGYTINCTGKCQWTPSACYSGYLEYSYDRLQCPTPKYALAEGCSWSPD